MRIVHHFQPSPEHLSPDWCNRLPPGFTLHPIDKPIAEQLQQDLVAAGNPAWFDEVWGGIDHFLAGGFGFAILHDGAVVSNCRAWSVTDGVAAIQVSTRNKYRRLGLAFVVCRAFISHCLSRGLQPEYSCVQENTASAALAGKLGFVPAGLVEDESLPRAGGTPPPES